MMPWQHIPNTDNTEREEGENPLTEKKDAICEDRVNTSGTTASLNADATEGFTTSDMVCKIR